jgi:hypothetical protein
MNNNCMFRVRRLGVHTAKYVQLSRSCRFTIPAGAEGPTRTTCVVLDALSWGYPGGSSRGWSVQLLLHAQGSSICGDPPLPLWVRLPRLLLQVFALTLSRGCTCTCLSAHVRMSLGTLGRMSAHTHVLRRLVHLKAPGCATAVAGVYTGCI